MIHLFQEEKNPLLRRDPFSNYVTQKPILGKKTQKKGSEMPILKKDKFKNPCILTYCVGPRIRLAKSLHTLEHAKEAT